MTVLICTKLGFLLHLRQKNAEVETVQLLLPKMERRGFEPLTPTLPVSCATNCANAPDLFNLEECILTARKAFAFSASRKTLYLVTFSRAESTALMPTCLVYHKII